MKIVKKIIIILCAAVCTAVSAQSKGTSGLILDFGGNVLVPQSVPTGMGGHGAVGYSARDFNILFRPQVLIADPGANQKLILIPAALFEIKVGLMPGFLTLLPYIDIGGIATKVKRADGNLGSTAVALYAEAGVGAELVMTHEIAVVPRLGIASALLYDTPDSINHSGFTASVSIRFALNRSRELEY